MNFHLNTRDNTRDCPPRFLAMEIGPSAKGARAWSSAAGNYCRNSPELTFPIHPPDDSHSPAHLSPSSAKLILMPLLSSHLNPNPSLNLYLYLYLNLNQSMPHTSTEE